MALTTSHDRFEVVPSRKVAHPWLGIDAAQFFLVHRERHDRVSQGLCPVGKRHGSVVLERLSGLLAHHEGSRLARWCEEVRQIGASNIDQVWERVCQTT